MQLLDLTPQKDPKGGSPKTPPGGISVRDYSAFDSTPYSNGNGNGVWKVLACSAATALMGMTVAWFTAMQAKGVKPEALDAVRVDFRSYVTDFYRDKELLIQQRNSQQDTDIGKLIGGDERITLKLNAFDVKLTADEKDISELKTKMELLANYLEAARTLKR